MTAPTLYSLSAVEIASRASVWRSERFLRKSMMSLPCAALRK
jgi:hypothetical protein